MDIQSISHRKPAFSAVAQEEPWAFRIYGKVLLILKLESSRQPMVKMWWSMVSTVFDFDWSTRVTDWQNCDDCKTRYSTAVSRIRRAYIFLPRLCLTHSTGWLKFCNAKSHIWLRTTGPVAVLALNIWGARPHGERAVVRVYNGVLGAKPPAESRGKAVA